MWINVPQNTDEWFSLRAGKTTGSSIGKVMANYGRAFGQPAKDHALNCAVERITGQPILATYQNMMMARGHEMEPFAKQLYSEKTGLEVEDGGFFDNGTTGCSPDGVVVDGIVEVKTAIPSVHYQRLRKGTYDSTYQWQIAFNLRETNATWCDFISYCPEFPVKKRLIVYRIYRDTLVDELQMITKRLRQFELLVKQIKEEIEA